MSAALRPAPRNTASGFQRSNGPVRADRGVLDSKNIGSGSSLNHRRSSRPSTAPQFGNRGSRPASPAGRVGSRPASPNTRPMSPGVGLGRPGSPGSHRNSSLSGAPAIGSSAYFDKSPVNVIGRRATSLYSQGRRAPSPTPQFNRASGMSSGKPRWRM